MHTSNSKKWSKFHAREIYQNFWNNFFFLKKWKLNFIQFLCFYIRISHPFEQYLLTHQIRHLVAKTLYTCDLLMFSMEVTIFNLKDEMPILYLDLRETFFNFVKFFWIRNKLKGNYFLNILTLLIKKNIFMSIPYHSPKQKEPEKRSHKDCSHIKWSW